MRFREEGHVNESHTSVKRRLNRNEPDSSKKRVEVARFEQYRGGRGAEERKSAERGRE